MRASLLAAALTLALAGCQSAPVAPDAPPPIAAPQATADARFQAISAQWLDRWMALNPIAATQLGDHRFDDRVDDLSANGRAQLAALSTSLLAELDRIDAAALSPENQVDALLLRNQLQSDLWNLQTFQAWAWDPQSYSGLAGGAIYNLMAREFAPMPQRLKSATARMEQIPMLFAQMRENIVPARVPKTHAETVAKQNAGLVQLVDQFITPNAGQLTGADRARLDAAVATLRKAVGEHQTWLDKTLVPNAKGDFRIGQELYDQKLKFALMSELSRAEIGQRAKAELTRVRGEMYGIAQTVLKGKKGAPALPANPTDAQRQKAIEAALELAYRDHPKRGDLVDASKAALAEATRFTREKDLVTVPDDPVKIILMPEFQRGFAVAYADSPGPLDKGLDTYFAISPVPEDWTKAQAESFLREYNSRMIHLLAIHEAMPGHYLEGAYSARYPSPLRGVLRSGLFAEGWAVYTEDMMADAGYMNYDPLFRLVQLKFYLRTISNAILDQGVHVDGWSREQAMHLMMHDAFQQEREAAGKWTRAQLSSAQLPTYFVGVQEQFDTRKAMEAKLGPAFNLKAYHDKVLSYGAPPVRFARQLMLDEPIR